MENVVVKTTAVMMVMAMATVWQLQLHSDIFPGPILRSLFIRP